MSSHLGGKRNIRISLNLKVLVGALLGTGTTTLFAGIEAVVVSGDTGSTSLTSISAPPVLTNGGRILFQGSYVPAPAEPEVSAIFSAEDGSWQPVVKVGDPISETTDVLSRIGSGFIATESGYLAFHGAANDPGLGDANSIFRAYENELTEIARVGESAPGDTNTFHALDMPDMNQAGTILFSARFEPNPMVGPIPVPADNMLVRSDGTSMDIVARRGQIVTDDGLRFDRGSSLSPLSTTTFSTGAGIDDAGDIVFWSSLCPWQEVFAGVFQRCSNTSSEGVFAVDGDGVHELVRPRPAPDGNGNLIDIAQTSSISPYKHIFMNENGGIAFYAEMSGTAGGLGDNTGIYAGDHSELFKVVRKGDASPDGNGIFSSFSDLVRMNDAGQVAFSATLTDTDSGQNETGLFAWNAGELLQYARSGMELRRAGTLSASSHPWFQLNQAGQASFTSNVVEPGGQTRRGLFIADDRELLEIVRVGDDLAGAHVASLIEVNVTTNYRRSMAINDHAQVVFAAALDDGRQGVFLYTPILNWRGPSGETWETSDNWTFAIPPSSVHRIAIDRSDDILVNGPADNVTVKSLSLGSERCNACILALQGSGSITALEYIAIRNGGILDLGNGSAITQELAIEQGGELSGNGMIEADIANQGGIVAPGNSAGRIDIDGSFTALPTSELVIELGGLAPASAHDQITVTGDAELSGKLTVRLIDDYLPQLGDRFDVLIASSITGTFSDSDLPPLSDETEWGIDYGSSTVALSVVEREIVDEDTPPAEQGDGPDENDGETGGQSNSGTSGGGGTISLPDLWYFASLIVGIALLRLRRRGSTPASYAEQRTFRYRGSPLISRKPLDSN